MPYKCGFMKCFSFGQHFSPFYCFLNLRLSSLNCELNFEQKKSNLCRLDVLVCCCVKNQYSEIGCVFYKALKNSARSKGQ